MRTCLEPSAERGVAALCCAAALPTGCRAAVLRGSGRGRVKPMAVVLDIELKRQRVFRDPTSKGI